MTVIAWCLRRWSIVMVTGVGLTAMDNGVVYTEKGRM